jgi:hypothetical protein
MFAFAITGVVNVADIASITNEQKTSKGIIRGAGSLGFAIGQPFHLSLFTRVPLALALALAQRFSRVIRVLNSYRSRIDRVSIKKIQVYYYDRKLAESNRGNKLTWKQKHYDAYAKPHALSLHDRIAASIQAS